MGSALADRASPRQRPCASADPRRRGNTVLMHMRPGSAVQAAFFIPRPIGIRTASATSCITWEQPDSATDHESGALSGSRAGVPVQKLLRLSLKQQYDRVFPADHSVLRASADGRRDFRCRQSAVPRAMSDQDRQHGVNITDLRRGARSPSPALWGRLHGWARAAPACSRFGVMVSHWKGPLPAIAPIAPLIDGQVNRDASPHTQSPGSSLRRRPQLAASCWRGVLGVGARAGPARTAARAVPAVLAEQDRPGPSGIRWLQSGRAAGTGLTGMPTGVSPPAALTASR
jgi:hypothetical protein